MKIIIGGCGLAGAVIARKLADNDISVIVYEKRKEVGGNLFDFIENGVNIHKFGPHIFHTNDDNVFKYIKRYTEIKDIRISGKTIIDGKKVTYPFNFESLDLFFSKSSDYIKEKLKGVKKLTIFDLLNNNDRKIKEWGELLYKLNYIPYANKQWQKEIKSLDESILKRNPIYASYYSHYFDTKYEFIPWPSYNNLFKNILNNDRITIIKNQDVLNNICIIDDKIFYKNEEEVIFIYTGAIDKLFSYKFGKLEYVSTKFKKKNIKQETEIYSYPDKSKYTRSTNYNLINGINLKKDIIFFEKPYLVKNKNDELFYPLRDLKNMSIYEKYYNKAKKIKNLWLCGRLATYKYMNMDDVILESLNVANKIIRRVKCK